MTHPALITDDEFGVFLEAVSNGDTNGTAARKAGYSLATLQYRIDAKPEWRERFDQARANRAATMADKVDRRMDELVADEKPNATIVGMWAKRWNPEYRDKQTVETTVTGRIEMTSPEVVEAVERFTAGVVQAASRLGTRKAPNGVEPGGNGRAGLPVGRLDSPS